MNEIPTFSHFSGADRVSIYEDGTLEIQHGDHSYRSTPALWISAAIGIDIEATPPKGNTE